MDKLSRVDIVRLLPLGTAATSLDVPNWPVADGRGLAQFRVQIDARGQEYAIRQIDGGTPQASPTASRVRIVSGSNNKTYFIGYRKSIRQAFLMSAQRNAKPIWLDNANCELFKAIKKCLEC